MRGWLVRGWAIAAMLVTTGVLAQQPAATSEPAAGATPRVADVTLRAVKDRRVRLTLDQGKESTGKLLAFEADTVTLALDDGSVVTLARAQIAGLKLDEPVAPPPAPPIKVTSPVEERAGETVEAPPPPRPRYFGAHLGMAPGVAFDLDYSYFHAFTSFAWLFPLVSSGQLISFTVGLGVSLPLSDHWRFDIFAHVAPLFWRGYSYSSLLSAYETFVGVGGGIGFHYTAPNGFSIGVKLPVIGAAAGNYGAGNTSVGLSAGFYYLASAMSLPVFSVGYRF